MSSNPGRGPAISAHRGGSEHGPGGTYEAYQNALAIGADYVEFDVRQTRDGILVAMHAERASRRYRAGADAATAEVKSGSTPSCANMADVPIWQLNSWILLSRMY